MQGKRRANSLLKDFSQRKANKTKLYSGVLGITTNGAATVEVTSRDNFVWVRLRNATNEVIQAFNDVVALVYDLPVMVEYDPFSPIRYRIVGRDIGRYSNNWGGSSTGLPAHGNSHSFTPDGSGGGDVVWIYSPQIMPFLIAPSGTSGQLGAVLYPYYYYSNSEFHYAGATGTPNLAPYKPTNNQARMILLMLDTDSGNVYVATGTSSDFAVTITGSAGVAPYIPPIPDTNDIPLAGVRLLSGTTTIQWANLYDVRPFFYPPGGLGGGGAPANAQYVTMAFNGTLSQERVLTAGTNITIVDGGANGNVTMGVATGIFALAGQAGGGNNVLPIFDDSVFKATGTAISFDNDLEVHVTGTTVFVSSIAAGGGSGGFPTIYDDSQFIATGTRLSFNGNLNVVATGTSVFISALDTLVSFHPHNNEPPLSNYATLDTRNQHPVLDFDPTTDEAAIFTSILPRRYGGGGLTVDIHWTASTSTGTATSCRWEAAFEAISGQDLDEDGFAAAQSAGGNPNVDSGKETITSIPFTDGAQMDSLAAGGAFRLKINRDANGDTGTDDMVGDAELLYAEIRET